MQFARRRLAVLDNGALRDVEVRVFSPEEEDRAWICRYEIDWPERVRKGAGFGVDGVQALTIALQNIGVELYASPYHRAGTLVFDKAGNGYGFPIAKSARHLLVGDDAKFDGN
jgi:hypothetical protein